MHIIDPHSDVRKTDGVGTVKFALGTVKFALGTVNSEVEPLIRRWNR